MTEEITEWKRTGDCQQCGSICCRGWDSDPVQIKLGRVENLKPDGWVCEHLTPDGKCSVYGTDKRPKVCNNWPTKNTGFYLICKSLGCTFNFEKVT